MEQKRLDTTISQGRTIELIPFTRYGAVPLPSLHIPHARAAHAAHLAGAILIKASAVVVIAMALRYQFSLLNFTTVVALLERAGWRSALVLLPALLATVADTAGWASCVVRYSIRGLVPRLLHARLGCDALCNSLPAGVAWGETLRPVWLQQLCTIDAAESVASCVLAKVNMAAAQALYICATLGCLYAARAMGKGFLLTPVGVGPTVMAGLFLLVILAGLSLMYTGSCLTRGLALAKKIPWSRMQHHLAGLTTAVLQIDGYLRDFRVHHLKRLGQSLASFFVGWILMGCESLAILTFLNVPTSPGMALSLEALASLLRIVFFFIPSALGASEIGYATLIAAFGIPDPVAVSAAFVVLKRSREVVWILLGYAALFRHRWNMRQTLPTSSTTPCARLRRYLPRHSERSSEQSTRRSLQTCPNRSYHSIGPCSIPPPTDPIPGPSLPVRGHHRPQGLSSPSA